jgi:hypothetical protein
MLSNNFQKGNPSPMKGIDFLMSEYFFADLSVTTPHNLYNYLI